MGEKRKYWISAAFMLLLFSITYGLLFRRYDINHCLRVMGRVRPGYLALAAAGTAGFIVGEGLNIRVCMQALGRPIGVARAVKYALVDFYFSAITPSASGGQPVQIYYMAKEGYPMAETALSIMLMSVIFKAVLLVVGLPIVFLEARLIFLGLPYFRILFALGIAVMLIMTGLLLFVMFSKTLIYHGVRLTVGLLGRLRLLRHPERRLEKLLRQVEGYHGAADLFRQNHGLSAKVFGITLIQRACLFSVAWCIYKAFGLSGLSWIDVVAIQIGLSITVDQLPFPGAIGVAEGVFLGLYRGIYGPELLVPAMMLTRGITLYLPMVVSGVVSGVFHFRLLGRRPNLRAPIQALKEKGHKKSARGRAGDETIEGPDA